MRRSTRPMWSDSATCSVNSSPAATSLSSPTISAPCSPATSSTASPCRSAASASGSACALSRLARMAPSPRRPWMLRRQRRPRTRARTRARAKQHVREAMKTPTGPQMPSLEPGSATDQGLNQLHSVRKFAKSAPLITQSLLRSYGEPQVIGPHTARRIPKSPPPTEPLPSKSPMTGGVATMVVIME